jgi:hypothetical protein
MRTRRLRRAPVAAAVAAVAAVLTGCSAGFDATSIQPYAPSDGVLANTGEIRLLNVLVVAPEGSDTGVVSMTVVNRGQRPDRLTEVTSPHGTVELTGDTSLPPGQALQVGQDGDVSAVISDLTREAGQVVTLRFAFSRTEPVTVDTVIVPASGDYAELTPSAPPSPLFTSTATPEG